MARVPVNFGLPQNKLALLNIQNYELNDLIKNKNEFIKQIIEQNRTLGIEAIFLPEILQNQKYIQFVFTTKDTRDIALTRRITIGNLSLKLEQPRNEDLGEDYEIKYIRVYGMPYSENIERIKNHFKNFGYKVMNQPKQTKYKNTEIKDGGWEMKIAIQKIQGKTKEVPCYQLYKFGNQLEYKTIIQIWYPGAETWCRKCLQKGHKASQCTAIRSDHKTTENEIEFEIENVITDKIEENENSLTKKQENNNETENKELTKTNQTKINRSKSLEQLTQKTFAEATKITQAQEKQKWQTVQRKRNSNRKEEEEKQTKALEKFLKVNTNTKRKKVHTPPEERTQKQGKYTEYEYSSESDTELIKTYNKLSPDKIKKRNDSL